MTVAEGPRVHGLTEGDLAALVCGGDGEPAALATLRASQFSKHKLLVRGVVRFGSQAVPDAAPALHRHYALLTAVERAAPETVAAVLRHPHTGAWAAQCLRQLSDGGASVRLDLDYLGAIAAAAAVRAGHACTLTLRTRAGALMLPTLGRAHLAGEHATLTVSGPMRAVIVAGGSMVAVHRDPQNDAPGWQGLRWLSLGGRSIPLDDLDPYRDYGRCVLTDRLDAADVARWQRALDEAWPFLTRHYPSYAAALRDGVTSLVPIRLGADEKNISATSGDAFAAVAASAPSDGVALALALVHEFQHAKLCAVIDLEPLFDRNATALFYAPWRPDPRPIGGLLHGIYAHLGVTDFWRVHRRVASGPHRLVAEVEFTRWLRQTLDAATRLQGHGELTAAGRQFLSRLVARLTGWVAEPVPPQARELAETTASDHWSCWRLRNLVPDPEDVARLATDWQAGRQARGTVRTRVCPPASAAERNARPDLLYLRLRDPARFDSETADRHDDPDVAFARGDRRDAALAYLEQVRADPTRQHAWTGLGLSCEPAGTLRRCPEVVCAVYHQIGHMSASRADPVRLAAWLDPVSAD